MGSRKGLQTGRSAACSKLPRRAISISTRYFADARSRNQNMIGFVVFLIMVAIT